MMRRRDVWPLGALGFILAVTASWWALALWTTPGAPAWLERTRSVCFNITESGLPDAKGWLLLVGQPLGMVAVLLVGWGREVRDSLAYLASFRAGKVALLGTCVGVLGGLGSSGAKVLQARMPEVALVGEPVPAGHPRLELPWPGGEGLVDQTGDPFTLGSLDGRPAMITFAFGHCKTVCPAVVHQLRAARLELTEEVSIVVLTLDPWRDTPSRLGALLSQFELDASSDHVVGGAVDAVEDALDAWGVERQRNLRTGDIVHPSLAYLSESDGTLVYASTGASSQLLSLADRLGWKREKTDE